MASRKAIAYIDGFNLYHGALRGTPFRWLDLVSLMDDLLRRHDVQVVKYFTSQVRSRLGNPGQDQRQAMLLDALRAHCGDRLEIHFGTFSTHKRKMPLVPSPLATPRKTPKFVRVYRTEEKGSDVNLASHLLRDAFQGRMEVAAVVSNDSDLQTPVTMAQEAGIPVVTINPHQPHGQRQCLHGTERRKLTKRRLSRNLLPDPVVDGRGHKIGKPPEWS